MPRKPKSRPRRPNAEAVLEAWRRMGEKLFNTRARRYLQCLLDEAQAKTKYRIWLGTGMGSICLYCEAPRMSGGWDTLHDAAGETRPNAYVSEKTLRLRRTFPRLISFYRVVCRFDDILPGDMRPMAKPRPDDGTPDPVDYVEYGPIIKCGGCSHTGHADWDFIQVGNRQLCNACANKPRS